VSFFVVPQTSIQRVIGFLRGTVPLVGIHVVLLAIEVTSSSMSLRSSARLVPSLRS
jgi:hypothetical protein